MITKSFRMTAVAALLCGVSAMAVAAVTAGTYEGAAQGKLSTVKAAVTLNQDGRITDVSLTFPAKPLNSAALLPRKWRLPLLSISPRLSTA